MNFKNLKYLIVLGYEKIFSVNEKNRSQEEWFYFLHIPKTAGTTFRLVLYDNFGQSSIYPNYYDFVAKQNSRYLGWKEFESMHRQIFPENKKLLIGHFGIHPLQLYAQHPPKTLCFFREPVRRVMSSIVFHMVKTRRYAGMSIDEILEKHLKSESMIQARSLGYMPKAHNISQVLKRIDQLDFIGISEQFERSLNLCNETFNWKLKNSSPQNVGTYSKSTFSENQIQLINDAVAVDRIIYEYALSNFEKRCSEYSL